MRFVYTFCKSILIRCYVIYCSLELGLWNPINVIIFRTKLLLRFILTRFTTFGLCFIAICPISCEIGFLLF